MQTAPGTNGSNHFADRLLATMDAKATPICVGIDPVLERLPDQVRSDVQAGDAAAASQVIESWAKQVLATVAPHVPIVKPQSACFERYGSAGMACLENCIAEARRLGLMVILDAKRGDIGSSAAHYAAGNLVDDPQRGPDALTINSYLGDDSLEPFIDVASSAGKGLFVLVRTSNPGSDSLQTKLLTEGGTVAEAVASMVARLGAEHVGENGYSLLGAVVGATKPADMAALRKAMPQQTFLVPGFGAQGGTADDVRACFDDQGRGAIITASRSVIFAHARSDTSDWRAAVEQATVQMKQQVAEVL